MIRAAYVVSVPMVAVPSMIGVVTVFGLAAPRHCQPL
jgi:hypothetical protein